MKYKTEVIIDIQSNEKLSKNAYIKIVKDVLTMDYSPWYDKSKYESIHIFVQTVPKKIKQLIT